jgi:hypothetical protein
MTSSTEAPAVLGPVERHVRHISLWMGRPMDELTREELLDVIAYCGCEIQSLRGDRDRWRQSGDAIKYLMAGRHA